MRFIYEPEGDATVMHIELHNKLGKPLYRPLCGLPLGPAYTINLPLDCPICPTCQKIADEASHEPG